MNSYQPPAETPLSTSGAPPLWQVALLVLGGLLFLFTMVSPPVFVDRDLDEAFDEVAEKLLEAGRATETKSVPKAQVKDDTEESAPGHSPGKPVAPDP